MRVTGYLALKLLAAVFSSAMLVVSPLAVAADKVVHSVAELDDTLHDRTFSGRVVIPKDSIWLMERCDKNKDEFGRFICTPVLELPIYSGVTLIGERGELGSRPLLFTTFVDKAVSRAMFQVCGNDIRIEGLHLRGPQTGENHGIQLPYFHGIRVFHAAGNRALSPCAADNTPGLREPIRGPLGRNVVIADNELEQWTGGAVSTVGVHGNIAIEEWGPHTCAGNSECCGDPDGTFAPDPDDDACWKPLTFADAGLVRIERNFMHHNARDNGGYGVDVNGGSFVTITGNVFNYNRHAVTSTGRAHSGYVARFNYVLQGGYRQDPTLYYDGYYNQHMDVHGSNPGGYGGPAGTQFDISLNTFRGAQTYAQVQTRSAFWQRGVPAIGIDFRDNVLVHGSLNDAVRFKGFNVLGQPPSSSTAQQIAKFHPSGNRYHSDTIRDLATGDFDGDGVTDIFITHQGQWSVWRGATKAWEVVNTSPKNISELLFGEFDRVRGTDVAMVLSDRWAVSSGAVSSFNFLNKRFAVTFKNAIAADFDGNGLTDIAFRGLGGRWEVGADGQGERRLLGLPDISRDGGLVGRFDKSSPRAMIIYNAPQLLGPNRFKIWRGYGTTVDWRDWSDHDMR